EAARCREGREASGNGRQATVGDAGAEIRLSAILSAINSGGGRRFSVREECDPPLPFEVDMMRCLGWLCCVGVTLAIAACSRGGNAIAKEEAKNPFFRSEQFRADQQAELNALQVAAVQLEKQAQETAVDERRAMGLAMAASARLERAEKLRKAGVI